MLLTKVPFIQPVFKEQVFFLFKDTEVQISHKNQGCFIPLEPEYKKDLIQLLRLLQIGGITTEQLEQTCPNIKENIPQLLIEFDKRNLLIETKRKVTSPIINGEQFYQDLYQFCDRLKQKFPPSAFSQKMTHGTITRNQIIGYALESYHVTHLCPRLLAPSIANYESPATQKLLQDFFASELHHDRLIENSLKSVGINQSQLQQMQPLPMTFALCSTLGVLSKQHSLSYKSALMLFEQDDLIFHQLFKQQCEALKLPSEFYRPILLHASINEEGEHEDITKILLAEIEYIFPEEQLLVKKNMAILMEFMVLRTNEILEYYGNPDNLIPRCFS